MRPDQLVGSHQAVALGRNRAKTSGRSRTGEVITTGQVAIRPGTGRYQLNRPGALPASEVEGSGRTAFLLGLGYARHSQVRRS